MAIYGRGSIIGYRSILECKNEYFFDVNTRQKLINSISAGNTEIACGIIEDVFSDNFVRNHITIEMAKCLVFEISGAVIKAFSGVYNTSYTNEILLFSMNYGNVESIKECFIKEIKSGCMNVNAIMDENNMSNKVISFLSENYMDDQISVTYLGDKFDIAPSYLSRIFSKQTGITLTDYINKVRIDHAKDMLSMTKKSIKAIGLDVGYVNSNVFIRTFKRFEGMTPGQYRDKYKD